VQHQPASPQPTLRKDHKNFLIFASHESFVLQLKLSFSTSFFDYMHSKENWRLMVLISLWARFLVGPSHVSACFLKSV
jgi:hypothetical protein